MENKIPPPIVLLITLVVMWFTHKIDAQLHLSFHYSKIISLILLLTGIAWALFAVISFRRAKTTVNPLSPESATSLVTSGVFRLSRNPMYTGMLFVAIAWAFYLGSLLSLSIVLLFVVFITVFQIIPEERAMERLFGEDYLRYKKQTRRWF